MAALTAQSEPESDPPKYQEVFYTSGNLRIQAYLYKPDGNGPFFRGDLQPTARETGGERTPTPFPHVGGMLTRVGYVVLVPERRGYGKSDGEIWWKEVGSDQSRLISRLQAENRRRARRNRYCVVYRMSIRKRLAVMGWSFGGVVSMLAAARGPAFLAAVDQAGGALTWTETAHMRKRTYCGPEKSTIPTLFMVAKNDRTTASVTTLADVFEKRTVPHKTGDLRALHASQGGGRVAPGHALFFVAGR